MENISSAVGYFADNKMPVVKTSNQVQIRWVMPAYAQKFKVGKPVK